MEMVAIRGRKLDLKDQRKRNYHEKESYDINGPSYYLHKHVTHTAAELEENVFT